MNIATNTMMIFFTWSQTKGQNNKNKNCNNLKPAFKC